MRSNGAQVRSEVQQQALQELTQNLQTKCFDKCITRPNGKLDGKQQNCLALCINRYIDTMKVVSQTMVERGPQVCSVCFGNRTFRFDRFSHNWCAVLYRTECFEVAGRLLCCRVGTSRTVVAVGGNSKWT